MSDITDPPKMPPPSDNDELENTQPPSDNGEMKYAQEPRYTTPNFLLLKKFKSPYVNKVLNRNVASGEIQIKHPEFSSIYPGDQSQNHALLIINYLPRKSCVESKSLSLYLKTFEKYIESHDACITIIINDLINLLDPHQITVIAESANIGGVYFRPACRYVRK